jgi:uncharacterized protein (TIGR02246 family)
MPYRLSALAEQDLEEIWSHVAGDASLTTADRLIDAIFDIRSFVVESYVIYYRDDEDLLIARVLHGRRDQTAAWSERSWSNACRSCRTIRAGFWNFEAERDRIARTRTPLRQRRGVSMKPFRATLVAVVLASAAHGSGLAMSAQTPEQREEDAIEAVIAGITDAFNKHDAKAWVRFATPDARLTTVRGEAMNGAAEIEKGLMVLFQTRNRNATVRVQTLSIRLLRPDVALAYVASELSGVAGSNGQTLPPSRELSLRVFVKGLDGWRLTAFHNTPIQP